MACPSRKTHFLLDDRAVLLRSSKESTFAALSLRAPFGRGTETTIRVKSLYLIRLPLVITVYIRNDPTDGWDLKLARHAHPPTRLAAAAASASVVDVLAVPELSLFSNLALCIFVLHCNRGDTSDVHEGR